MKAAKWKNLGGSWKSIFRNVSLLGLTVLFIGLLISAAAGEKARVCSAVQISMDGTQDLFFIDPHTIKNKLGQLDRDTFQGMPLNEIHLAEVESSLEELPHVQDAEAWFGSGGTLCVHVEQRVPMLRVIHNKGVSYYLDIHGEKMPSTRTFTARVPVLTGVDAADQESLAEVVGLATFIRQDPFLAALVEHIHRTASGEYELVPKIGDHVIKLGGLSDLPAKFQKLETVYRDGLNYTGWDTYRVLDLRYQDLVYGTKAQSQGITSSETAVR